MPRVLLLLPTTSYRTQAFMEAAQRLGVQVTAASEEPSTVAALNPAGFLTIDLANPAQAARQVVAFAARCPIDAVVPVDDQVAVVGAAISRALGLASNSVESAAAARDKYCMRELLARARLSQPRHRLCSLADDFDRLARQVAYPCVVKPLSLAASRGVIRADDGLQFVADVRRLAAILQAVAREQGTAALAEAPVCDHGQDQESQSIQYSVLSTQYSTAESAVQIGRTATPLTPTLSPRGEGGRDGEFQPFSLRRDTQYSALTHFLVEQYIPGPEVALEGLLRQGQLSVLALFDKPDPLEGPFFEETIYVTPSRLPAAVQDRIAECTAHACRALGLTEGPVHAELRLRPTHHSPLTTHQPSLTTHQPYIIEINPRSIGGLCSRVLRFGTGLSLEELIIRHALDREFVPQARERLAAGVMMIPVPRAGVLSEVRGLSESQAVAGIEQVVISARLGQELVPLPEGGLYLGFIFARGESPEQVEAALRQSHARLEFSIGS